MGAAPLRMNTIKKNIQIYCPAERVNGVEYKENDAWPGAGDKFDKEPFMSINGGGLATLGIDTATLAFSTQTQEDSPQHINVKVIGQCPLIEMKVSLGLMGAREMDSLKLTDYADLSCLCSEQRFFHKCMAECMLYCELCDDTKEYRPQATENDLIRGALCRSQQSPETRVTCEKYAPKAPLDDEDELSNHEELAVSPMSHMHSHSIEPRHRTGSEIQQVFNHNISWETGDNVPTWEHLNEFITDMKRRMDALERKEAERRDAQAQKELLKDAAYE